MNAKTAILALVGACLLAVVTYFVMRPPGPKAIVAPPTPSRLTSALASTAITVQDGRDTVTLTASPELEMWFLRTGADVKSTAWPVEPGAIQGALRLLSELARRTPTAGPVQAAGTLVTIDIPNQPALELRMSDQSLGGKTKVYEAIATGSLVFEADSQLVELFKPRNVLAWRRADVLGMPGAVTEVQVASSGRVLAFRQVDGRWGMTKPIAAPVDAVAIKELAGTQLNALRFVDGGSEGDTEVRLRDPVATFTKTTRVRTGAAEPEDLSVEVMIGAAADPEGATYYAGVTARRTLRGGATILAWGPAQVVLDQAAVSAIARTPEYYVSKRAVQAASADVVKLQIFVEDAAMDVAKQLAPPEGGGTRDVFQIDRTLDGWTRAGDRAPMQEALQEQARSVIAFLCEQQAIRVHLALPGEAIEPICAIAVSTTSGGVVEVVGIGVSPTLPDVPTPRSVYVRSGRVVREYSWDTAGSVVNLLPGKW